jgi:hypothetical protein
VRMQLADLRAILRAKQIILDTQTQSASELARPKCGGSQSKIHALD